MGDLGCAAQSVVGRGVARARTIRQRVATTYLVGIGGEKNSAVAVIASVGAIPRRSFIVCGTTGHGKSEAVIEDYVVGPAGNIYFALGFNADGTGGICISNCGDAAVGKIGLGEAREIPRIIVLVACNLGVWVGGTGDFSGGIVVREFLRLVESVGDQGQIGICGAGRLGTPRVTI